MQDSFTCPHQDVSQCKTLLSPGWGFVLQCGPGFLTSSCTETSGKQGSHATNRCCCQSSVRCTFCSLALPQVTSDARALRTREGVSTQARRPCQFPTAFPVPKQACTWRKRGVLRVQLSPQTCKLSASPSFLSTDSLIKHAMRRRDQRGYLSFEIIETQQSDILGAHPLPTPALGSSTHIPSPTHQ